MALATVAELIGYARVILQDQVEEYRYSDTELLDALNAGLMEARRLRPDMFLADPETGEWAVPLYTLVDDTPLGIDQQYRMALAQYVIGQAHLRDEEETTDARAAAFMMSFHAKLTSIAA